MPVRSLRSSVLRWPDRRAVDDGVRRWAAEQLSRRDDIVRIGYFGSYARGDQGVGSDVDLVVVVRASVLPFERRAAEFDCTSIAVPCDLFVYTIGEFRSALSGNRFGAVLRDEAVWVYVDTEAPGLSGS